MKLKEYRPTHIRIETPEGSNTASFAVGRDGCTSIDARPEGVFIRVEKSQEAREYIITPSGYGIPLDITPVKALEPPRAKRVEA